MFEAFWQRYFEEGQEQKKTELLSSLDGVYALLVDGQVACFVRSGNLEWGDAALGGWEREARDSVQVMCGHAITGDSLPPVTVWCSPVCTVARALKVAFREVKLDVAVSMEVRGHAITIHDHGRGQHHPLMSLCLQDILCGARTFSVTGLVVRTAVGRHKYSLWQHSLGEIGLSTGRIRSVEVGRSTWDAVVKAYAAELQKPLHAGVAAQHLFRVEDLMTSAFDLGLAWKSGIRAPCGDGWVLVPVSRVRCLYSFSSGDLYQWKTLERRQSLQAAGAVCLQCKGKDGVEWSLGARVVEIL